MKSKKVFLVLKRKALKMLSYVNDELYKELDFNRKKYHDFSIVKDLQAIGKRQPVIF